MAKNKKILSLAEFIDKAEWTLIDYLNRHDYLHEKLSKIATKINPDLPYTRKSASEFSMLFRGMLAKAKSTKKISPSLQKLTRKLESLVEPKTANMAVQREIENLYSKYRDTVFNNNFSGDKDVENMLKVNGLWDDKNFWSKYLRSSFYQPIYMDYKDKELSPELSKFIQQNQRSYWGKNIEDFMNEYMTGSLHNKSMEKYAYQKDKASETNVYARRYSKRK